MEKLDIILLVPVYQCANILDEWAGYIRELDPKPSRIVFCENNSTDGTLEKVRNLKFKGIKTEVIKIHTVDPRNKKILPFSKCYDVIGHVRQLLLTRARQLDPDYAIFIDSDVFLHESNTIHALTLWEEDIMGGAYGRTFPGGVYIASLFYASNILKERGEKWVKRKSLKLGVLRYEVHATSGGCLCLSRKAIQTKRLNFSPVLKKHSEDFGYCARAHKLGFKVWLDGTIRLGHKIEFKWKAWDVVRKKDDEESRGFDDGTLIDEINKGIREMKEAREAVAKLRREREARKPL